MPKVVNISTITTLDVDSDNILEQAKGKLSDVLVIGYETDGSLYIASSTSDIAISNIMLDLCKTELLEMLKKQSD